MEKGGWHLLHWLLTVTPKEMGFELPTTLNSKPITFERFLGNGRTGSVYAVLVGVEPRVLKLAYPEYQASIAVEKKMLKSLQKGYVYVH